MINLVRILEMAKVILENVVKALYQNYEGGSDASNRYTIPDTQTQTG